MDEIRDKREGLRGEANLDRESWGTSCQRFTIGYLVVYKLAGKRGNIYNLHSPHNFVQIAAGAAAATGTIELTRPMAVVAVAYIVGQTVVDTWGE